MKFGKAVKSNVLQTSKINHNLSNDVFISNNIINNDVIIIHNVLQIIICCIIFCYIPYLSFWLYRKGFKPLIILIHFYCSWFFLLTI